MARSCLIAGAGETLNTSQVDRTSWTTGTFNASLALRVTQPHPLPKRAMMSMDKSQIARLQSREEDQRMTGRRSVGIWKDAWLPSSETFIVDHLATLERWNPIPIGFTNLHQGAAVRAALAPYPDSGLGRIGRHMLGTAPFARRYDKLLSENAAEIIHAHFASGGVNASSVAARRNIPLVTTFHGGDAHTLGSRISYLNHRHDRRMKALNGQVSLYLASSTHLAKVAAASGIPEHKIRVHYLGTAMKPPSKGDGGDGIVFVGRLVEIKAADELLRAVAAMPTRHRRTRITLVGDGPEKGKLERLARDLGLNAHFKGWLSPDQRDLAIRSAAVFCVPTRRAPGGIGEGLGLGFLEAAVQGRPSVAYQIGGIPEAVRHGVTGILAREADLAGLTSALTQLLDDSSLQRQMGVNARTMVEEVFDLEKQVKKLEAIYDELTA